MTVRELAGCRTWLTQDVAIGYADDWELMEAHAQYVESNLLRQVLVCCSWICDGPR